MAAREEYAGRIDRAYAAAAAEADSIIADLRRPISLVGCGGWQRIPMMLVQIGGSDASIRVRLPHHAHQSTSLPRKSIVIHHVETAWDESVPNVPGFLIVMVPGWLASDRLFEQAKNPQLSSEIEWTAEQRAAWDRMRKRLPKPPPKRRAKVAPPTKQRLNGYVNSGW